MTVALVKNEIAVERRLIELLHKKNIFNVKGNAYNLKGYPDRLVFADKIYFVEVKVGKEMGSYYGQTPMQKWWEKKIKDSAGTYVLLKGLKEVENWVSTLPDLNQ
jgi:hypothetical protein